jgi:Flp pilus assembly protein TadD
VFSRPRLPLFIGLAALALNVALAAALGACASRRGSGAASKGARAADAVALRTDADKKADLEKKAALEQKIANHRNDLALRFEYARLLHWEGVDGDEESAERGEAILLELRAANPNDPRILAYCGSARILETKRTVAYWRKGALADEALTELDRAVELAPEDLEVRYLRAVATRELPDFFNRAHQCSTDFAFVAARAPGETRRGALEPRVAEAAMHYQESAREERNTNNRNIVDAAEAPVSRVSTGR